jgi:catechol 2,3-dioxygenase-like lactoylglutathione lyase family enzyme
MHSDTRAPSGGLSVTTLDHLVLNVGDVETAAAWYQRVLGMARETFPGPGGEPRTALKFGAMKLNLRPVSASTDAWFTGATPAAGSADLCFLTETPPEAVRDHLTAQGVDILLGPVPKQGARGTIISVYCRDPGGNLVEVSSYPSDERARP